MFSSTAVRRLATKGLKETRAFSSLVNPAGAPARGVSSFLSVAASPSVSAFAPSAFKIAPQLAIRGFATGSPQISDAEAKKLFYLWNDALATLNPDTVAKRYAKKCVLLPTVSDEPRTTYEGLQRYFTDFLKKKPHGVILESHILKGDDYVLDAGIYEFTMGATGDKVKARYTFSYVFEDGEWKISHHHSSIMPESFL